MTLCDTGSLVAIINAADSDHHSCVSTLSRRSESLLTTWPCITEAMYLLSEYGGIRAQEELWSFLEDGLVTLHHSSDIEWLRMRVLMRKYQDSPMDLADASLVVLAEHLRVSRVFTLDSHFFAYRIGGKQPFEVVP